MTVTIYYNSNSKRDVDFDVICDARYIRVTDNKLIIKGDYPQEINLSEISWYEIENN
jgi:hypothetical protein